MIIRVMKIFLHSSSVYSCHLFLISSASVRSIPFLSFIVKYSLGISNFLEEISSLSHSIVFPCFFTLITEKGFLISSCYSLQLCIQIQVLSFLTLVTCLISSLEERFTGAGSFCLFTAAGCQPILGCSKERDRGRKRGRRGRREGRQREKERGR